MMKQTTDMTILISLNSTTYIQKEKQMKQTTEFKVCLTIEFKNDLT